MVVTSNMNAVCCVTRALMLKKLPPKMMPDMSRSDAMKTSIIHVLRIVQLRML